MMIIQIFPRRASGVCLCAPHRHYRWFTGVQRNLLINILLINFANIITIVECIRKPPKKLILATSSPPLSLGLDRLDRLEGRKWGLFFFAKQANDPRPPLVPSSVKWVGWCISKPPPSSWPGHLWWASPHLRRYTYSPAQEMKTKQTFDEIAKPDLGRLDPSNSLWQKTVVNIERCVF